MTESEFAAAVQAAKDKLNTVRVDPTDLAGSKDAIIQFVSELSLENKNALAPDAVTYLYSDKVNGVDSWRVIVNMHEADPSKVRYLGDTVAAEVLNSDKFKAKIAEAFGLNFDDFIAILKDENNTTDPAKIWMNKGGSGPWAKASEMFVDATTGVVRILAENAPSDSCLVMNEMPKIVQNLTNGTGITEVQGIPRNNLNLFETSADLRNTILNKAAQEILLTKPTDTNFSGWKTLTQEIFTTLSDALKNNETHGNAVTEIARRFPIGVKTAKALPVLGSAFFILAGISTSVQAEQAMADGKPDEALHMTEDFAAEWAGSTAAEVVGGILAGVGLTIAGVAVASPVGIATIFIASVLGGYFGGDWGKEIAYLYQDRSDEKKRDTAVRMLKLIFGDDASLSSEIPDELSTKTLVIDGTLSRDQIVEYAKEDIAWRYALRELNTFVITGDSLYDKHNKDSSLDLYNEETGEGEMTELYLQDRAAMLTWKLLYDLEKKPYSAEFNTTNIDGNWDFVDIASATTLQIDGVGTSWSDHQIVFGSRAADAISGSGDFDHLYGGAGNDTIDGGKGDDYIEGNSGADILTGGEGSDTLLGGSNDDILTGGTENDVLQGGTGNDTYVFASGDGTDIITDFDGVGSIKINEQTLGNATRQAESIYKDATSGQSIVKVNGGNTLIVFKEGTTDRILVNDWSTNSSLGITLQDTTPTAPEVTLAGDFKKKIDDQGTPGESDDTYVIVNGNYVEDGVEANALDLLIGTGGNDVIDGKGGDDALTGKGGDDYLIGGNGSDAIQGGLGKDTIIGGIGDDIIYGSSDDVINLPEEVDFTKPVNTYTYPQGTGFNWTGGYYDTYSNGVPDEYSNTPRNRLADDKGNLIDGGAGDDFIAAGTGADTVHGGTENDYIYGMDKDDVLFGDGGNDLIYGDGNKQSNDSVVWTLFENHGNDIIDGGDGDDILIGQGGHDIIFGGSNNDKIWGDDDEANLPIANHGNDFLFGGSGNDQIVGGGGSDYLEGGTGDDTIWGGAGKDIYVFNKGDGIDTIYDDKSDNNIFRFGAGFDPKDVKLGLGSLLIDLGNGDAVHIGGFDQSDVFNSSSISSFEFVDGGTLSIRDLLARGFDLEGTAGNDSIAGTNTVDRIKGLAGKDKLWGMDGDDVVDGGYGYDYLDGGAGNDSLIGGDGIDTLIGGNGNDTLSGGNSGDSLTGGEGSDTYLFSRVDRSQPLSLFGERDVVDNFDASADSIDSIRLEDDVKPEDICLFRRGDDLLLVHADKTAEMLVENHFNPDGLHRIDQIIFKDVVWDAATIAEKAVVGTANTMTGTAGDDTYTVDHPEDIITENANGGTDTVNSWVSTTLQRNVENLTLMGTFNINGYGNEQNNVIRGNSGDNDLHTGHGGGDTLIGGAGDDVYYEDSGSIGTVLVEAENEGIDTVWVSDSYYELPDNVEILRRMDQIYFRSQYTGNALDNVIDVSRGGMSATINGGAGADTMIGSNKADVFYVDNVGDQVLGGPDDEVYSSVSFSLINGSVPYVDADGVTRPYEYGPSNLTLLADSGDLDGTGNSLNNTITGNNGNNVLNGRAGDDVINGIGGNDTLIGGMGNDRYVSYGHYGNTWVIDNAASDNDTAVDTLEITDDVLLQRNGDDLVVSVGSYQTDTITVKNHFAADGQSRLDQIKFADGTIWNAAQIEQNLAVVPQGTDGNDTLTGFWSSDILHGLPGNDSISGDSGDDRLFGEAGNDTLNGDYGNDTLEGGTGNDLLVGSFGNDLYSYRRGDGVDVITDFDDMEGNLDILRFDSSIAATDIQVTRDRNSVFLNIAGSSDRIQLNSWLDGDANKVEQIEFAGGAVWNSADLLSKITIAQATTGADQLFGLSGADSINGLEGDDYLAGLAGNDTLVGGAGNDTYEFCLGDGNDVIDNAASDNDSAFDSLRLGEGITETSISLTTLGDDLIVRISATDSITLKNYLSTQSNCKIDQIVFSDGPIWDQATIESHIGAGNDILTGTTGNDTLHGYAGNDTISGGAGDDRLYGDLGNDSLNGDAGNDLLDGGTGTDQLKGGTGNDTYVVDNSGDVVTEAASAGTDLVQSSITYTLGSNLENLTLTGSNAINGTGNTLDNILTGNSAANVLSGGAGNDTYYVGIGDTVTEAASAGTDTVISDINWTLGSNLENLTLIGTSAINGTGNTLNNTLTGNSANNTLNGGAGNDTLKGGLGDDTYVVDSTSDVVTENASEGTDLVQSSVTCTLSTNVENLTLTGTTAINGTGNTLNNIIIGNSAANTLNGGTGTDTMQGGAGNDTYVVDNTADVVSENASEGTDLVQPSVSYTLGANVENLTLTGTSAINATGNTLANTLTGNSSANILDGGTGIDTMVGGTGNDTYVVDNSGDVVTEAASAGTDLVQSSITYTLGANVENLTLTGTSAINGTGNTLNNVLIGNSANNTLSGGTGADTLQGGAGNDTYVVDNTADLVTEALNEGTDLVQSSVTYTLGANVENLTLTGTTAINGTGNALDNVLTGNSANNKLTGGAGNDTLDGGAGNDTMAGGLGNDTYVINVTTDVITENANEGTDLVNVALTAAGTYTLGTNIENATVTSGATIAVSLTGNTAANVLTGNAAANTLNGGAGNDTLDGKAGADILVGGTGNDIYVLGRGYGADTVRENDTTSGNADVARFSTGISTDQIWLRHVGNNLEASIIGTSDKLIFENWYLGNQYHTEQFKTADNRVLLDSQVESLVQAMATFAPPASGQTTLPINYQTALAPVLAANWQ